MDTFALINHQPELTGTMSPPPETAAADSPPKLSTSFSIEFMVVTFILFFLFFLFFLIHFLRKNRFFPPHQLNSNMLKSLPITTINSADFKGGVECAVCLSELVDGEEVLRLPGCRHGFHPDCIDKWFGLNLTCPVCRSSVDSKVVILESLGPSPAINEGALQQRNGGVGG